MNVEWGDAKSALAAAPVTVDAVYTTPREYNVPCSRTPASQRGTGIN